MNNIEILENCWLMKTNHVLDEENKKVRQAIENLIKENKELKENKGYHLGFIDGGIAKRYEYEDKIKEKIEYYQDLYKQDNSSNLFLIGQDCLSKLLILQELLEEGE